MPYVVALTGTIASGKSVASSFFGDLGAKIISADEISRKLTARNQPAFEEIKTHFGESILASDGELDRRKLRQHIFNDSSQRAWLEQLLHPLIRNQIKKDIIASKAPYCMIEIPLLPNKTDHPYLNRILLVTTNQEHQIKRLIKRDNCSIEHALLILSTQGDENRYRAIADDTIINNGSINELKKTIMALHKEYLLEASKLND